LKKVFFISFLFLFSAFLSEEPQTGYASYYGKKFHGRRTASGEKYHREKYTAAHRTYPFGTIVRVTHLQNNREVLVKINDRGPHVRGRIIDVSYIAAQELDILAAGHARVKIEKVENYRWVNDSIVRVE
jgi:rare lipoprotein A